MRLFRYIAENRDICLCALDSLGREYLKGIFEADIKSIVRSAVRQMVLENGFPEDAEREELTTRFLTLQPAVCWRAAAGRADADAGGTDPTGRMKSYRIIFAAWPFA